MNPKKNLDLDAIRRAQQQRVARAAESGDAQVCIQCGHNIFVMGGEIVVLSPLETGLPKEAIMQRSSRYICALCGKSWLKGEKKDEQETIQQDKEPLS